MDTTNQNANSTPSDGESKQNEDTAKDTNIGESGQQEAENLTGDQSKEAPHILKPQEDALLRGVNKI